MNGIKYLLDTNIIIGFYEQSEVVLDLVKTKNIKLIEALLRLY